MTSQVRTASCSIEAIMRHPNFLVGLNDIRANRKFNCDLDDNYWAYERGRMLGMILPRSVSLYVGRKLNPDAVRLFEAAFERRLVI